MTKTVNKENDDINKERLVDIILIINYMKTLDIDRQYFTEVGQGFLEGLASVKDEIKFISFDEYNKLEEKYKQLKQTNKDNLDRYEKVLMQNLDLKEKLSKSKRSWFK